MSGHEPLAKRRREERNETLQLLCREVCRQHATPNGHNGIRRQVLRRPFAQHPFGVDIQQRCMSRRIGHDALGLDRVGASDLHQPGKAPREGEFLRRHAPKAMDRIGGLLRRHKCWRCNHSETNDDRAGTRLPFWRSKTCHGLLPNRERHTNAIQLSNRNVPINASVAATPEISMTAAAIRNGTSQSRAIFLGSDTAASINGRAIIQAGTASTVAAAPSAPQNTSGPA